MKTLNSLLLLLCVFIFTLTACGPKTPQTVEEIIEALRSESQEEQLLGVQALQNRPEQLTHSERSEVLFPLFGTLLGTSSADWMIPGGLTDQVTEVLATQLPDNAVWQCERYFSASNSGASSYCITVLYPLIGSDLVPGLVENMFVKEDGALRMHSYIALGEFVDRCELAGYRELIEESMPDAYDSEWAEDILQRLENCS